jgi:Encapsulating protein for peroxidase
VSSSTNREGFWTDQVWSSIDEGVAASVGAIRTAQKVFPAEPLADTTSVPAGVFDPATMAIAEGLTKPYIELAVEFPLTNGQVNQDPTGTTAITLSKLAAKALALAEDIVFLQGTDATLPSGVRIESGAESGRQGLLGLVSDQKITVRPPDRGAPTNSGGEILSAIAKGIALLTSQVQAPQFALIEDTNAFAATWGSVINGAPAYTVLNPVLTGGIYGTGGMPPNTGLLIALGGDPTTIFIGTDATTEPTFQDRGGLYYFRTFERVQCVALDKRAFVRLDFSYLSDSGKDDGGGEPAGDAKKQAAKPGNTG